jgi:hypothetical protein
MIYSSEVTLFLQINENIKVRDDDNPTNSHSSAGLSLPRDTENTNQMLSFSCSALEITNRNY